MIKNKESIKAYIGTEEKFNWYITAFSEFSPTSIGWKWSWYGFFFGPIYLAYRKCYLETVISLIASSIIVSATDGIGSIFLNIVMGGLTPYVIYRRYVSKVKIAKSNSTTEEGTIALLREYGGVSILARNIMIMFSTLGVLTLIFMVTILGFLSGM